MTVKFFKLECDEDLIFIRNMFDRAMAKMKTDATRYAGMSESIERIHYALHNPINQADLGPAMDEAKAAQVAAKPPKKSKSKDKPYKPNFCTEHPMYKAVRVPSTDCSTCWLAYKQFHPTEYDNKRREFERKLKIQA